MDTVVSKRSNLNFESICTFTTWTNIFLFIQYFDQEYKVYGNKIIGIIWLGAIMEFLNLLWCLFKTFHVWNSHFSMKSLSYYYSYNKINFNEIKFIRPNGYNKWFHVKWIIHIGILFLTFFECSVIVHFISIISYMYVF